MYRGYTDKQVESMSNGCGSQVWYLRWLRPPHGKFFMDPCNKHDVDYHIGGSEEDRLISDKSLKTRMCAKIAITPKKELIKELYTDECGVPNWIINLLPKSVIIQIFKAWSVLYCKALSLGGKSSFNYV